MIPQEAFLEVDAVSFTKGCFVGQELVCRIDSRGHVNRFLRHLVPADDGRVLPVGAEVTVGDKVVGTVTSSAPGIALGYVRREVEPPGRRDRRRRRASPSAPCPTDRTGSQNSAWSADVCASIRPTRAQSIALARAIAPSHSADGLTVRCWVARSTPTSPNRGM